DRAAGIVAALAPARLRLAARVGRVVRVPGGNVAAERPLEEDRLLECAILRTLRGIHHHDMEEAAVAASGIAHRLLDERRGHRDRPRREACIDALARARRARR